MMKTPSKMAQAVEGVVSTITALGVLRKWLALFAFVLAFSSTAHAASYYVDPATGNMTNPGTSALPWSTLQAVFTANKTFAAGDIIYLRSGYHGFPTIKGNNTGIVTIQPDTGAAPKLRTVDFNGATNWVLSGVDICPANAGAGTYITSINLVNIRTNCSLITIQNSTIEASANVTGWTVTDWQTNVGTHAAFATDGTNTTFAHNVLTNVGFGIVVSKNASFSLVSHNTVQEFYEDGMRGLADDCIFEYNTVKDSYVSDSNHDDCFQSWSTGTDGSVGTGTVYRVTLRNNLFLSKTDPSQPLQAAPQGMGSFDGMFSDWVVENNIVASQTYHGLSLYGAINCKIINNTVVENPLDTSGNTVRPWILITSHKNQADGTAWPVANSGNEVRNNITSKGATVVGGVADHNVTIATAALYNSYFADYANFDFSLKSTSPAVGAGDTTDAPTTDFEDRTRSVPYDIGAYEYGAAIYEGFDYATTTNISTSPDSASDAGFLGTTWGSTSDVIAGLTYSGLGTIGNAVQFTANVGCSRSVDPTALPSTYSIVGSDGITRLGNPGTTLWYRVLLRCDVANTGTQTACLNLDGAATGGGLKVAVGDIGTGFWGIKQSASVSSTVPIVTGQTVLLVVRVQFIAGTNNDIVDLFVNPTTGPTAPTTPSCTFTGHDIGAFDKVEFKGTRTSTGDEFSMATDWGFL